MRLVAVAGFVFLLGGALSADDPCQALGVQGPYKDSSNLGNGTCNEVPLASNAHLIARVINNQAAETKALKDAIDSLTKAVGSLESTSKNLMAADQKWQTNTLNTTIAAIDKLPGTLAAQKTLQDVLTVAIKEQLLKDSTFLEAVKKAP